MPPQQVYRSRNQIVSKTTYYRRHWKNRDDISLDSNGLDGDELPLSQTTLSSSFSLPSSLAPITTLGSSESPSTSIGGTTFGIIPILLPKRSANFEFHTEEIDMLMRIGFVDGRIPQHPLLELDVSQVIASKVLGLQAN